MKRAAIQVGNAKGNSSLRLYLPPAVVDFFGRRNRFVSSAQTPFTNIFPQGNLFQAYIQPNAEHSGFTARFGKGLW